MKRNRERVSSLGTPAQNSAIGLPFIIVNTNKNTTIDCSISSDKYVFETIRRVLWQLSCNFLSSIVMPLFF